MAYLTLLYICYVYAERTFPMKRTVFEVIRDRCVRILSVQIMMIVASSLIDIFAVMS